MGTINVDFYRVEIANAGDVSFESLIQQVLEQPIADRVKDIRAVPIWLCYASIEQNFIEGDMMRLGMNDIPVKGNLEGLIENIQLNKNEGLGVQSAFLYHIPSRVLLLQSRKSGITYGNLARYVTEAIEKDLNISIHPVLQLEALQKLDEMQDIRKVEVRVAGLDHLSILGDNDYAVGDVDKIGKYFESPYLSLELSVGRAKNKSLSLERTKKFVKNLFKLNTDKNKIKRLKITGDMDDEESLLLDLLKDRMREQINHNYSGRTLPYAERIGLLKTAWERKQEDIFKMYSSPH